VIYHGRPGAVTGEHGDFALEHEGDLYLFITDLTRIADSMVYGKPTRGTQPRQFNGVQQAYKEVRWMDNQQSLDFSQKDDVLTIIPTAFPYGTNTVVRIARCAKAIT